MRQRKQYIINKKFQLKTTFSVIAIVFVIVAIIIAAIGVNAAYNNKKLINIIQIQDNIVEALIAYSQSPHDSDQKLAIQNIANDHVKNINTIKEIIELNNFLLLIIITFVILQGIILYFVLIRKTHKIAGPIYVMSNYFNDIIKGNIPNPRPLRKNDELQDFYALFMKMVDAIRSRQE
ncbi:MAG TPA: hypothetical protein PL059_10450 [Spirochaetota bacterium]|nr:hypothetical protein [Spirochaetota bacterium]HOM10553.1 hypothetical protein [Spirochaetota bacterium]HPP50336.1 hypothetical protein [Spirochaetota bacterium]